MYQHAILEFMRFTGIREPEEFRIIAGRHHDRSQGEELDLLRIVHLACRLADVLGYDAYFGPGNDYDRDNHERLDRFLSHFTRGRFELAEVGRSAGFHRRRSDTARLTAQRSSCVCVQSG